MAGGPSTRAGGAGADPTLNGCPRAGFRRPAGLDPRPSWAYLALPLSREEAHAALRHPDPLSRGPRALRELEHPRDRAERERGGPDVLLVDFRDFTRDRHRTVDDRPFGGAAPAWFSSPSPSSSVSSGWKRATDAFRKMALLTPPGPTGSTNRPGPSELAAEERSAPLAAAATRASTSASASSWSWEDALDWATSSWPAVNCRRSRCIGGESVCRLLPGVRWATSSSARAGVLSDSRGGSTIPHYTRPRVFRGQRGPARSFVSGDHAEPSHEWRRRRGPQEEPRPEPTRTFCERVTGTPHDRSPRARDVTASTSSKPTGEGTRQEPHLPPVHVGDTVEGSLPDQARATRSVCSSSSAP